MPVIYLNVNVSEMNSNTDEVVEKFGKIRTKIERIGYYCIGVEIPFTTPEEVKRKYEKIISDLSKKKYVTRVGLTGEVVPLSA